jgi:hypothetical protein
MAKRSLGSTLDGGICNAACCVKVDTTFSMAALKKMLMALLVALHIVGDERGHDGSIRCFLPRPVHNDIVFQNLRLSDADVIRKERFAVRIDFVV